MRFAPLLSAVLLLGCASAADESTGVSASFLPATARDDSHGLAIEQEISPPPADDYAPWAEEWNRSGLASIMVANADLSSVRFELWQRLPNEDPSAALGIGRATRPPARSRYQDYTVILSGVLTAGEAVCIAGPPSGNYRLYAEEVIRNGPLIVPYEASHELQPGEALEWSIHIVDSVSD